MDHFDLFVRAKCKHIHDELWRWQANKVTTIFVDGSDQNEFFVLNEKNEKCLEFSDFARKLVGKKI